LTVLTFKKILCPIDFSDTSYSALNRAVELAARTDQDTVAELHLLHVLPPAHVSVTDGVLAAGDAFEQERANVKLQRIIKRHVPQNLQYHAHRTVKRGDTALEILRSAEADNYDLIVMGTHGLTGWRHLMLGSVAEEVVRLAPCPVLTVRLSDGQQIEVPGRDGRGRFQKILCPTDFSEPSFAALHQAGELAASLGAELCVLNVMESLEPVLGIVSKEEFEAERRGEVAYALLSIIERHVPAVVQERAKSNRLVRSGKAAEEIVRTAEAENADLIVIATRGQTGWRHLAFGSVAEEVVRTASCAVLTIHVPQTESAGMEPVETKPASQESTPKTITAADPNGWSRSRARSSHQRVH
jgi:nucleotide-binding universal stress UspA family protein